MEVNIIKADVIIRLLRFTLGIDRFSKTLKTRGFEIEVIKPGRVVDLPIPAIKEKYSLYINPVEAVFTVSSMSIEESIKGCEEVIQILKRDFKVTKSAIVGYSLDCEVSIKTKKNAKEAIEKKLYEIPNKLGLTTLFGKEVKVDSIRTTIPSKNAPGGVCIISPWSQSPDCYYIRLVLNFDRGEGLEKLKSIELEKIARSMVENIEM